jgi:hypothetical protein
LACNAKQDENNKDDKSEKSDKSDKSEKTGNSENKDNTEDKNSQEEPIKIEKPEISPISERKDVNCKIDSNCSSFFDFFKDMAYCNETSHLCTNYCFVKTPCKTDYDCNFSIGDSKKCGVQCYKNNLNDTEGKCLIVSKEGQYCNGSYIICEGDLICDYYTSYCITKAEAQTQSGEPLFSLFLFMLIMLSLFNRQRADEDLLNNMTPNELLMVTLPSRRRQPEDDILPVYQPLDDNNNEDEVIEQNLEVPTSNEGENSTEHLQSNNTINEQGVDMDDDLPLLPPTYDEAISSFVNDNDDQPLLNNEGMGNINPDYQQPPQNNENNNSAPSPSNIN